MLLASHASCKDVQLLDTAFFAKDSNLIIDEGEAAPILPYAVGLLAMLCRSVWPCMTTPRKTGSRPVGFCCGYASVQHVLRMLLFLNGSRALRPHEGFEKGSYLT